MHTTYKEVAEKLIEELKNKADVNTSSASLVYKLKCKI